MYNKLDLNPNELLNGTDMSGSTFKLVLSVRSRPKHVPTLVVKLVALFILLLSSVFVACV